MTTASTGSKESIKQSEQNSEDSTDEMFQSFASRGGESSPEQLINAHFDLENLQEEELDRLLQDEADITSAANEKPGRSASTETSLERNIEPEPEKVVQAADLEKPQEEDLWIRRRNSLLSESSKSARTGAGSEKGTEPEPEKNPEPQKRTEQEQQDRIELHIAESGSSKSGSRGSSKGEQSKNSSGSDSRRSSRIPKPVDRFNPSPVSLTRKLSIPSIRTALDPSPRFRMPRSPKRSSVGKAIRQVFKDAWMDKPRSTVPASLRRRSSSRESTASTRTRAASLEKLQGTGSIKC